MYLNKCTGIVLTVLFLSTFGCQQMQIDSDGLTSVSADDVIPVDTPYLGTVVIGAPDKKFGTDDYILNNVTIDKDTLQINVSYGGGCEKHEMTLIVSDSFLESFPVQLHVSLAHNANGDTCEAWLTEDYNFDMTPIKTMYQEAYRQEAGTIHLRLKDATHTNVVYKFTM